MGMKKYQCHITQVFFVLGKSAEILQMGNVSSYGFDFTNFII